MFPTCGSSVLSKRRRLSVKTKVVFYAQSADLVMKFINPIMMIDMAVCLFFRRTIPQQRWVCSIEQAQGMIMIGNGNSKLSRVRLSEGASRLSSVRLGCTEVKGCSWEGLGPTTSKNCFIACSGSDRCYFHIRRCSATLDCQHLFN